MLTIYTCTSFGVNCTWISFMFVRGSTVSTDRPGLAKCPGTRLNQSRTRQEVITLVTIVVSTETTGLPCPPWSKLKRQNSLELFCSSSDISIFTKPHKMPLTFNSTRPRPSQSRRRLLPNFTRTEDWTDLWICRWPVRLHTGGTD